MPNLTPTEHLKKMVAIGRPNGVPENWYRTLGDEKANLFRSSFAISIYQYSVLQSKDSKTVVGANESMHSSIIVIRYGSRTVTGLRRRKATKNVVSRLYRLQRRYVRPI